MVRRRLIALMDSRGQPEYKWSEASDRITARKAVRVAVSRLSL